MKRLLKKISSVTLQHATTLEKFISICDDGEIKPYSQTSQSTISNSLDPNSVYLSKSSGYEFANDMIYHSDYQVGVFMNIGVDENNLLPSYDFREFVFPEIDENTGEEYYLKFNGDRVTDEDVLDWKDSLDINDECRHNGSISINNIVDVTFVTTNKELFYKFKNIFDKKLSLQAAKEFIDEFNETFF